MSIFTSLFGAPAASAAPAAPAPAPAAPAPAPASPLAAYADLWNTESPKPGETPPASVYASLTPETVRAVAAKLPMSAGASPEQLAAIQAGGAGGVQAFNEVLQAATREAFVAATLANAQVSQRALDQQQSSLLSMIPQRVTQTQTQAEIFSRAPHLSNPAAAPVVEMLLSQVAQKFPNASPAEQAKHVETLLSAFGPPAAAPAAAPAPSASPNWEAIWGMGKAS